MFLKPNSLAQSSKCQQADWASHKSLCRRVQKVRQNAHPKLLAFRDCLSDWCLRNRSQLGEAGSSTLLRHRDHRDHNLLDTHFLCVEVAPRRSDVVLKIEGDVEFDVQSAVIRPLDDIRAVYVTAMGPTIGATEYQTWLESEKQVLLRSACLAGKVAVGTMFVIVWCNTDCVIHRIWIDQRMMEDQKNRLYDTRWLDRLKMSVFRRGDKLWRKDELLISRRKSD